MSQPPYKQGDHGATVLKEQTTITPSTCPPQPQPAPPPAYTPRSAQPPIPRVMPMPMHCITSDLLARLLTFAADARPAAHADQHDCAESMSPISIKVNTAVRVSQSDNLVDIGRPDPSDIAAAIVGAIERASSASAGVPMIDGNGEPRPIKIDVDATVEVGGSRNVVGKDEFLREYLRTLGAAAAYRAKRRRSSSVSGSEDDGSEDEAAAGDASMPAAKRSRST
ncbi:hypothetical protein PpBr36_00379 [Pyricularia pennisetigena]|uniref:hypothetical protein n=1 Tax=Pyricularia pennisetigena TaxID=1578925 RepID=UPI00114E9BAA|nr:hypothetical protein PpBr36_00379 [Pyricularia pennisetigena]TLS27789.1 hypothetical protein PpBr36_00379 [Pyricularia pennisetigena]